MIASAFVAPALAALFTLLTLAAAKRWIEPTRDAFSRNPRHRPRIRCRGRVRKPLGALR